MAFPNLPTTGSRYQDNTVITSDTLSEPTTKAEKDKQEEQKQNYQDYLDSRRWDDSIEWINNLNDRLNGNGKISTPVTSLRKKPVIPSTINIDDFISMWNSKIDEMYKKNIKNNKYQNVISNINSDYIFINYLYFKARLNDTYIKPVTLVDNIKMIPKITSSFTYRDLICIITNDGNLYYQDLNFLLNNNFTIVIDDISIFKSIPLIESENITDILFEDDYFVLITSKNQILVSYQSGKLKVLPTVSVIKYNTVDVKKYDTTTLNIVNTASDLYQIGFIHEDEIDGDNWYISEFNINILNNYDTSSSSLYLYDKKFSISDCLMFHISDYTIDEKTYKYIIKKGDDFLYYFVDFNCKDDNIDCDIRISNITFLFNNEFLLKNIKSLGETIVTEYNGETSMYFYKNSYIWKVTLDNEDSTIQKLISTTSFLSFSRYADYIIARVNDGYYIITDDKWCFIKSKLNLINNILSYTSNNILNLIPITPFVTSNNDGYILNYTPNLMFLYNDDYKMLDINNLYDENKNLIGFFDRYNNHVKMREII